MRSDEDEDLVRGGEAAEVALPGRKTSSASGSRTTAACASLSGTMWSASPCHHRTGALRRQAGNPSRGRRVGRRPRWPGSGPWQQDEVVDEHALHLGIVEDLAITLRGGSGVGLGEVVRQREQRQQQRGHRLGQGPRRPPSTGANRRAKSIAPVAMASGPTDGTTPPRTATAATRPLSGGTAAHASAYGPPPERPTTPSRWAPRESATCATSVTHSATDS